MSQVPHEPKHSAPATSGDAATRLASGVALATVFVIALLVIFAWLGGDQLVGDEHNAVYFLKDGLWDYIKTFHYGHLLKIQFWAVHALFGNSFFWYRMPAALASAGFVAWLAWVRTDGSPRDKLARVLVILFVVCNMQFLYFARWGMPNYAESILIGALLLTAVLPETGEGLTPRWTGFRLALIALLPWVYPATVILLGAMSAYFGLCALSRVLASRDRPDILGCVRMLLRAAVPMLLGVVSFLAYRLTVPDAQWERARGHHASFKDWIAGGHGGMSSFVRDSLGSIGKELLALPVHGGGKLVTWSSAAYAVLGLALAAGTTVALVLVVVRALRMKQGLPVAERRFLHGGLFLATVLLASLAVALGGSLLDAFPAIGMRHLFFLVPVMALLFVLSVGYLGGMATRFVAGSGTALATGRILVALIAVLLGGLLATTVLQQRRAEHARMQQLMDVFHSPKNDIIFSYAPGFFVSKATISGQQPYFMTDSGPEIPGAVIHAVRERAASAGGGRIALLMRTSALNSRDSQLDDLIRDYGLQLIESVDAGNHTVLAFHIPHGVTRSDVRTVDLTVPLPSTPILAVRLDPTQFRQSTLTVGLMEVTDASGKRAIDLCGDRKLTLVRSLRIGSDGKCSFVLGNSSNSGWFAPGELRNLPASMGPRLLHVRMTGKFGSEIKVYLDQGGGFSNPIRMKVADALVAPELR
jgi:hypothetical protein